jgi:hypothetical protein
MGTGYAQAQAPLYYMLEVHSALFPCNGAGYAEHVKVATK